MFNFELPSEQLEKRRSKFVNDYDKFFQTVHWLVRSR